ncbi:TPA_asm: DUF4376 domain-containing protein [Salmonella enterica subsp. enterica serovar Enteritidis]|nr:DUF4376 domain-containing protein [Salmonella enterica subsp. enterica serovar Enteritidis]
MVAQAQQSAEAAAKSEQNAKSHADNAAGSAQQTAQDVTATETARDDAERFAENARQDAVATAEDRKATAEDVTSTGANAAAAGQSAQDAAGYARAAEQAKTDIDITLAGTLKTVNHLSEIAAAGQNAQQESRYNLGLKDAATMDVQSSIYDRTEGRVAMPGAFGYGAFFRTIKMFSADTVAAKAENARDVFVWGDASNQQVHMTMAQAGELVAAMAQAQVDRNDEIYRRQREKKEALDTLEDLDVIRAFNVE